MKNYTKQGKWEAAGTWGTLRIEDCYGVFDEPARMQTIETSLRCSLCGESTFAESSEVYNYCPFCGAEMDNEKL